MDLPIIDKTSAAKSRTQNKPYTERLKALPLSKAKLFGSLFLSNLFGREKGSGVPEPIPFH
jgi:hypothetical protein